MKKVLFLLIFIFLGSIFSNEIELNKEEKEYLHKKKVIKMCVDPDWFPFEIINQDNIHEGISADLIKIIKDKLNLNIEVSKDSYIYVFIKDENDKVCEYYPNIYQKENLLSAKNILKFPDSRIFDIELNANGKDTLENVIVLACKEPLNLLGFEIIEGINIGSYKSLAKQIIKIDKAKLIKYSGVYKIIGGK